MAVTRSKWRQDVFLSPVMVVVVLLALKHGTSESGSMAIDLHGSEVPRKPNNRKAREPFSAVNSKSCDYRSTECGLSVNCSGRGLSRIPHNLPDDAVALTLSHNRLRDIPPKVFHNLTILKVLDLSYNNISYFRKGAFDGLGQLESLNLHGNTFMLSDSSFDADVFSPTTNLTNLNMKSGKETSEAVLDYPDKAIGKLSSLVNLTIDGLTNKTFGSGFRNLTSLRLLDLSMTPTFTAISKNMFANFRNIPIKTLNLSYCDLAFIDEDALYNFPMIDTIDYSQNHRLGLTGVGKSTKGLQNSTIRRLFMEQVYTQHPLSVVTKEDMQYLARTKLKEVYLDKNRIALFGPEVIVNGPFSLETISCQRNVIEATRYDALFILAFYQNIKQLLGSYQINNPYKSVDGLQGTNILDKQRENAMEPFTDSGLSELRADSNVTLAAGFNYSNSEITISLPPKLWNIGFSHTYKLINLGIPAFSISNSAVTHADFSYNLLQKWKGPVKGIERLLHLDLSGNECTFVSPFFFGYATGLETLNISRNRIGPNLDDRTFYNLTSLKYLDISHNVMQTTFPGLFSRLTNLTTLDFSYNFLFAWGADISPLTNLLLLNLSHNTLTELPLKLRQDLDQISGYSKTEVDLRANELKCVCETQDFVSWMDKTTVDFVNLNATFCTLPNGTRIALVEKISIAKYLRMQCRSYATLIGITSLAIGTFCVFLIVSLIYRNRWKLRYLYYMAMKRGERTGYERLEGNDEQDAFFFDAFISYEDASRNMIVQDFIPRLETRAGLKLCIDKRDFVPGLYITDNIMHAILNSKKTVVLLTKEFMKSKFCMYELNMARMESMYSVRDILIVVILEDNLMVNSPREVMEIVQTQTYIEKPEDERDEVFWERLVSAIRT